MTEHTSSTHPLHDPGTPTWRGDSLPGAQHINKATTAGPHATSTHVASAGASAGGARRG